MRSYRAHPFLVAAIAVLAAAGTLAVPVAALAKAKRNLWAVSLSGTARTDGSYTVPWIDEAYTQPPAGTLKVKRVR